MEVKTYTFYGPHGETIPIIAPVDIYFPTFKITHYVPKIFGSYCGAGKGIGDIVVPESMWGLIVTLACYIHDVMWEKAMPTWGDFHQSNYVFIRNLITIVRALSRSGYLRWARMYRTVTYFNAVDTFGGDIFWKLKEEQGVTPGVSLV